MQSATLNRSTFRESSNNKSKQACTVEMRNINKDDKTVC